MTTFEKIYLASKSPRRSELLRQVGIDFEVLRLREAAPRGPDVTELVLPGEIASNYVKRVTQEKADKAWQVLAWRKLPLRPVLSADTTVVLDQAILGKPADTAQAQAMLGSLSGRKHQVMTSIALRFHQHLLQVTQVSEVSFRVLSAAEISAYCASQEPYDKTGGYGIQGQAARFIEHISGSYSGIMGLPLYETDQLLQELASLNPQESL